MLKAVYMLLPRLYINTHTYHCHTDTAAITYYDAICCLPYYMPLLSLYTAWLHAIYIA